MNRIVKILMERDGNTELEAIQRIEEVQQLIEDSCYDPFESEKIMYEYLGLEMDYIYDILP